MSKIKAMRFKKPDELFAIQSAQNTLREHGLHDKFIEQAVNAELEKRFVLGTSPEEGEVEDETTDPFFCDDSKQLN